MKETPVGTRGTISTVVREQLSGPRETVEPDRVRAYSAARANERVDQDTQLCLEQLAGRAAEEIGRHIVALEREWDMERYLQANVSIVSLGGLVLGTAVDRRFLAVPAIVFGFLLQHAVQGWCPPLPVFRGLGLRTRREINREKYALKALRGDFEGLGR